MNSVLDVADAVLVETGETDAWTLQKLAYYCQAWSVAYTGRPLFGDAIQAWTNGPVAPRLWQAHRGAFRVSSIADGDAERLSEGERRLVRTVVRRYKHMSSRELVAQTHREVPWRSARGDLPDDARGTGVIDLESMRRFYGRFAADEARGTADAVGSLGLEAMAVDFDAVALVREVAAGRLSGDDAVQRVLASR